MLITRSIQSQVRTKAIEKSLPNMMTVSPLLYHSVLEMLPTYEMRH